MVTKTTRRAGEPQTSTVASFGIGGAKKAGLARGGAGIFCDLVWFDLDHRGAKLVVLAEHQNNHDANVILLMGLNDEAPRGMYNCSEGLVTNVHKVVVKKAERHGTKRSPNGCPVRLLTSKTRSAVYPATFRRESNTRRRNSRSSWSRRSQISDSAAQILLGRVQRRSGIEVEQHNPKEARGSSREDYEIESAEGVQVQEKHFEITEVDYISSVSNKTRDLIECQTIKLTGAMRQNVEAWLTRKTWICRAGSKKITSRAIVCYL